MKPTWTKRYGPADPAKDTLELVEFARPVPDVYTRLEEFNILQRRHYEVRHSGDCSIYAYSRCICDCGALRETIRDGAPSDDTQTAWRKHVVAIQSIK